jgi:hypothetical protein
LGPLLLGWRCNKEFIIKFTKIATSLAIAVTMAATPALAGKKSMKNAEGTKLRIDCTTGNCTVKQQPAGAKWATVENMKASTDNYNGVIDKYQSLGFK